MREHRDSGALNRHMCESGHRIEFENPSILASDSNVERLYIKEAFKIQELAAYRSLNGNIGSTELKLW